MQSALYNNSHAQSRITTLDKKLSVYISNILSLAKKNDYTANESSLCIAGDETYQQSLKKALRPFKGVTHVVLVGIGGSSLGTEAVYHAL